MMRLSDIVGKQQVRVASDPVVGGLVIDSRCVSNGDVFCALAGSAADGHDFVDDAMARGAVAILAERPVPAAGVPVIVLTDLRERLSGIGAVVFGDPSRRLRCVGVTGTNGKTSVTHHLADAAGKLGERAAVMGTLGWGPPGALEPSTLTTADPIAVQRQLARLAKQRFQTVAMEVSSHALDQHRVSAVAFDAAVFTNLSRDHLDYHGTMAAYEAAKRRLFATAGLSLAVVNVDDPVGAALAADVTAEVVTFGSSESADVTWHIERNEPGNIEGRWLTRWGAADLELPLVGHHSVANAAAALAVLCGLGHTIDEVASAVAALHPVPGRMQLVSGSGRCTVVIDYAHTPDALAKALDAARDACRGRLFCVIGCGGDRDRGKRPEMAAIAERHADVVYLTSDNPRSEDPAQILTDMVAGLSSREAAVVEVDRTLSIERAIDAADEDDVVLVAGKGHEPYQEVAGVRHAYSDLDAVRAALAGRQ